VITQLCIRSFSARSFTVPCLLQFMHSEGICLPPYETKKIMLAKNNSVNSFMWSCTLLIKFHLFVYFL
jgi:hypothetical protein